MVNLLTWLDSGDPVVLSNTSLDGEVKAFVDVINTDSQLTLSKVDYSL